MSTYGFNAADAKRIGRAVRLSERDEPRQDLVGTRDGEVSRGVRLMIGKFATTVEPYATAEMTIEVQRITGLPTNATGTITSSVVVVKNSQYPFLDTAAYSYISNNGYGWHLVEGSQQAWCGKIEDRWPIGTEKTVTLHGCERAVTALNEIAPIHRPSGAEFVVAYTDDKWRVVNAETYHARPGTYDATSEWANGASRVVTFDTGGTANVRNDGASIGVWSGTARDCVAAYEYGQWSLIEAETYYVRRGTFSGTWDKDTTKTVTLTNGGSVTAENAFGNVGAVGSTLDCAVAYEAGTWFLIAAECG